MPNRGPVDTTGALLGVKNSQRRHLLGHQRNPDGEECSAPDAPGRRAPAQVLHLQSCPRIWPGAGETLPEPDAQMLAEDLSGGLGSSREPHVHSLGHAQAAVRVTPQTPQPTASVPGKPPSRALLMGSAAAQTQQELLAWTGDTFPAEGRRQGWCADSFEVDLASQVLQRLSHSVLGVELCPQRHADVLSPGTCKCGRAVE